MCHLLGDSSVEVQKPAYHLLQEAARKRTEHLVIETGVDIEDNILAELPNELVIILQRDLHQENESEFDENVNPKFFTEVNGINFSPRTFLDICLLGC